MGAQGCGCVEIPCKLCLGQAGVDFTVADMVHQHCRPAFAALQLGNEMVKALRDVRRDWPQTQRADRVIMLRVERAGQGLDPDTGLRHESGTTAQQGKGCPWISI